MTERGFFCRNKGTIKQFNLSRSVLTSSATRTCCDARLVLVLSSSDRSAMYSNHLSSISSGSVSSSPSLFWTPNFILVLCSINLTLAYISNWIVVLVKLLNLCTIEYNKFFFQNDHRELHDT